MVLSALRHYLGLPQKRTVRLPDVAPLGAYCDRLKDFLAEAGYEIAHASDYRFFAAQKHDARQQRLSKKLVGHFNQAASADTDDGLLLKIKLETLNETMNGYVMWREGIIGLPDEDGLLDRFAATKKLDAAALRGAGLTDRYLYAYVLIHEACHVMGNGPVWRDGDFTDNEYHVNARGHALFLQASGLPPDHPVPRFLMAYLVRNALETGLNHPDRRLAYGWVDQALTFVNDHWAARETIWDDRAGTFLPHVYESFSAFGDSAKQFGPARYFAAAQAERAWHELRGADDPLGAAAASLLELAEKRRDPGFADASRMLDRYRDALRVLAPYGAKAPAARNSPEKPATAHSPAGP